MEKTVKERIKEIADLEEVETLFAIVSAEKEGGSYSWSFVQGKHGDLMATLAANIAACEGIRKLVFDAVSALIKLYLDDSDTKVIGDLFTRLEHKPEMEKDSKETLH